MSEQRDYPPNTVGYHYVRSRAIFGADSPATRWLEKKAAEVTGGMDEEVIMPEEQVLLLLGRLHLGLVVA